MKTRFLLFICVLLGVHSFGNEIGNASDLFLNLSNLQGITKAQFQVQGAKNIDFNIEIQAIEVEDDYMALDGYEKGVRTNVSMFKGTPDDMYGWIICTDRNKAFEYTTNEKGKVLVEEVPISKILPVCAQPHPDRKVEIIEPDPQEKTSRSNKPGEMHIGSYPGTDVRTFESYPGATNVFYIDITRVVDNNGNMIVNTSKAELWKAWQALASSISMYDINVTTSRSVYDSYALRNSGIIIFYPQAGRSFAPLNSFGTRRAGTQYFFADGWGWGRTCAHEVGHQLGMGHDGDNGANGGEYYNGHRNYRWAPLMGNYWSGNSWGERNGVFQWSKGEHPNASRRQDDLSIIDNYLGYRPDDNSASSPRPIRYQEGQPGRINTDSTRGFIGRTGDRDAFSFEIGPGGGAINVEIDQIEYTSHLDVSAQLLDENGTVLDTDNPQALRYARFNQNLPAGRYTIIITGGAEGTPSTGFSNYGSLGYYEIEGTITNAVSDILDLSIVASGATQICEGESVTLSGADKPDYEYQWYRNNQLLSNERSRTIEVEEGGSYYVEVSNGVSDGESNPIEVEVVDKPITPDAEDVSVCAPGEITFLANASGIVLWYTDETSETPVAEGNGYTVEVLESSTFYLAQSTLSAAEKVGPEDNTFGTGGFHGGDFYNLFNAQEDLVIRSAKVYAEGSGTRRFVVLKDNATIASVDVNVPDGESRVELGLAVPAGDAYSLGVQRINNADVQLFRSNENVDYPYAITGLMEIYESSAAGVAGDFYYYLYDLEVQEGSIECLSEKSEVSVTVTNDCVTGVQDRLNQQVAIYPIPSTSQLNIDLPSNANLQSVALFDATGRLLSQTQDKITSFDVSNLEPGTYILRIQVDDVMIERMIVKK